VADAKTPPRTPAKAVGAEAPLLRRLRRLTTRATAVRAGDRVQLIALIDDLETVRLALLREYARLDGELTLAARRVMAFDAYARNRRSAGVPRRGGQ
jgi:hypothetical protein